MASRASVSVTSLSLPAYRFHEDPFPPLQGRRRRVYPYPMQDDLTDEKAERDFTAVILDNGLLRVTVLPEMGGHVLSMRDLVHGREVLYTNVPLKFGLIAMRGAWIACGIEFNFPHVGHSISTSDTVSWHAGEGDDGRATVWVGGVERLSRMAWTVALTLRPDDWRLGVRVRMFNRTPFWHRNYFWSNTAVAARDDLRLLLPATRVYSWWYGADGDASFPINKGRDLSRYTTFRRPGDVFAKDLRADWFGCYYEALDCGVLHQASRFDVPGRKLFTWGRSDDGMAWAELLNDRREPYVELQSGRYVHQGVHRLAPPGRVDEWDEAWAPVWGLGGVVHAAGDLALNAVREGDTLALRLLALAPVAGERLVVSQEQGGGLLAEAELSLAAGEIRSIDVPLRGDGPVSLRLKGDKVTLLVDGGEVRTSLDAVPAHTAVPEKPAEETPTTPQGWLLHARASEERGHAAEAAEAYQKAVGLDALCTPAMAGLAQWHLKRGEAAQARDWASRALQADPQHEDALWWSSVAGFFEADDPTAHLRALERSPRYAASALALLGELALRRGEPAAAVQLFARALLFGPHDGRVLALAAFAARSCGDLDDARECLAESEAENPLDPLLWSERYFLEGPSDAATRAALERVLGADAQNWLEAACDYERLGAWETAVQWLAAIPGREPMVLYHAALAHWRLGRVAEAMAAAREASERSPLFAFPHRHEDALALETALRLCPDDPLAHLLLGHWLASVGRWDDALPHWTRATQLAETGELAVLAWRNIGLARWHHQRNAPDALAAYAQALRATDALALPSALDPRPSPLVAAAWRLWLERDGVLAAQGRHEERVATFASAPDAVKENWQVLARWSEALLRAGRAEQALEILSRCHFRPWEGEARPRQLWKEAHLLVGHRAKDAGDFARAREHFEAAAAYPRHLSVGRPAMADDADALFWAGWCALQAGEEAAARRLLEQAADEDQPREAGSAEFKARAADLLRTLGA